MPDRKEAPMTTRTRRQGIGGLLDRLYRAAGALSALCLAMLLAVIVAQMVARWSSRMFPGGAEYAGYLMAAASFLGFAYTLNHGAHIRVGMGLAALGRHRWWGELFGLVIGTAASGYLAWYAVKLVRVSARFGDVSQGQDRTALWIAQMPVAVGAVLLALCFADNLVSLLLRGRDNINTDPQEQSHAE